MNFKGLFVLCCFALATTVICRAQVHVQHGALVKAQDGSPYYELGDEVSDSTWNITYRASCRNLSKYDPESNSQKPDGKSMWSVHVSCPDYPTKNQNAPVYIIEHANESFTSNTMLMPHPDKVFAYGCPNLLGEQHKAIHDISIIGTCETKQFIVIQSVQHPPVKITNK
jgi:hypothetical protein